MKRILLILFGFLTTSAVSSQQANIDSLESLLQVAVEIEEKVLLIDEITDLYKTQKEAELYVLSALDLVEKSNDESKCIAYNNAFDYYLKIHDYDKAQEYKRKEFKIWSSIGNTQKLGVCHYDLGYSFMKQYVLDSSIVHFKNADVYFTQENDWKNVILTRNRLGIIEKDFGNYAAALAFYHASYKIAEENNLKSELAKTCVNIGVVLKKQDQLLEALDLYREAEVLFKDEADYIGLANVYNNIGNVYRIQLKYQASLKNYKLAIENRHKAKSEKSLSYSYNNIALVFKAQNQYDSALYYLGKSEEYKIKLNEMSLLSSTYFNFAELYSIIGDTTKFFTYIEKAELNALTYNNYTTLQSLYLFRSEFESKRGNYEGAYEFLLKVVEQLDTLDENQQITLGKVLQAKFQGEQKAEVIAQLKKSNTELDKKTKQLANEESGFLWVTVGLISASFILVIMLLILLKNLRVSKKSTIKLKSINEELIQTRLTSVEKDVLIKEIHHRVKNNLQIIKSLIRLQNGTIEDQAITDILLDFENRVTSMALVHESLYKSLDLSKVNIKEYYTKLLKDLIQAYSLDVEVEGVFDINIDNFGIDTLIPLGLLTNEIISNALKHGFEGRKKGIISVEITMQDNGMYQLKIGDNGIGMHERFQNKQSLGMELIETLVEQLDGEMTRVIENGTHYIITFKSQDKN